MLPALFFFRKEIEHIWKANEARIRIGSSQCEDINRKDSTMQTYEGYNLCKHILDLAIENNVVVGETKKWAVICEDGILDEYPYWQVIEHLMQDEKDRAFLERQLDLRNLL